MAKRNYFIDVLKGIAIILVLFNHYEWNKTSLFNTHIYYWIICMAVPIFMLCSGYVFAVSAQAKNSTLKSLYSITSLSKKLARYIMPVLWFFLFETLLVYVSEKTGYFDYLGKFGFPDKSGFEKNITLLNSIEYFFAGGRGKHGTYYFPVILQVTFLLPLIYHTVKKHKWGIWLVFVVNLAFEVFKTPLGITSQLWRVFAVRYLFLLAMGCYIYIYREKLGSKYKWAIFFALGIAYVYTINYTPYLKSIFNSWNRTAMPSVFYIAPVFLLLITKFENARCRLLEELGKASYHILLMQIIYFNYFAPLVWTAPKSIIPNDYVGMAVSLVVCLGFGYGYYKLYSTLSHKFKAWKN